MKHIDVAIVGGGPAGAALANFLSRLGHRCCLFEQAHFPRYHIGESLIPNTYELFDKLGVLSKLKNSDFPRKHSVRFVSPTGAETKPFYFSERIQGD
jgi:2-polyprenyl-6-methoxyphenol hydroxylase-like FAD-dependent oxidoreductase